MSTTDTAYAQAVAAHMRELTTYRLANMADTNTPNDLFTAGAEFLSRVRDDVAERVEYAEPADADDLRRLHSDRSELADMAVPVWTVDTWATFTDLGAWGEDVTELGADASDMTVAANTALYMIAERLVSALIDDATENVSAG